MTSFLFWMIFIQVSIFFIAAILLGAAIFLGIRNHSFLSPRISARGRIRQRRPARAQALEAAAGV